MKASEDVQVDLFALPQRRGRSTGWPIGAREDEKNPFAILQAYTEPLKSLRIQSIPALYENHVRVFHQDLKKRESFFTYSACG